MLAIEGRERIVHVVTRIDRTVQTRVPLVCRIYLSRKDVTKGLTRNGARVVVESNLDAAVSSTYEKTTRHYESFSIVDNRPATWSFTQYP